MMVDSTKLGSSLVRCSLLRVITVNDDGRRAGASLYIVLGRVAWRVADGPEEVPAR
jgi:hypothetical protein